MTFVTVPRRFTVIRAKVAAAACCGTLFWLVGTVMAAVATPLFLYTQHVSASLAGWAVTRRAAEPARVRRLGRLRARSWRALRSQLASVIAAVGVYAGSFGAEFPNFNAAYNLYHQSWLLRHRHRPRARLCGHDHVRAGIPFAPPGWVGGVIMIGYTVALVAGGTA